MATTDRKKGRASGSTGRKRRREPSPVASSQSSSDEDTAEPQQKKRRVLSSAEALQELRQIDASASNRDVLHMILGMRIIPPAQEIIARPNPNQSNARNVSSDPLLGLLQANTAVNKSDALRILSSHWLKAKDLKRWAEITGLQWKEGQYSTAEDLAIRDAMESFKLQNDFSDDGIIAVMFSKSPESRRTGKQFWPHVAMAVPLRPLQSVYSYCKRYFHPMNQETRMGPWTEEEDANLIKAVRLHGYKWTDVRTLVGRPPQDCRVRYLVTLHDAEKRTFGRWSPAEVQRFIKVVRDLQEEQAQLTEASKIPFWTVIYDRMGRMRTLECYRAKWMNELAQKPQNDVSTTKWTPMDSYTLVRKIKSLKVADESEINWKLLPDVKWNREWNPSKLQHKWRGMTRAIPNASELPYRELIGILVKKYKIS